MGLRDWEGATRVSKMSAVPQVFFRPFSSGYYTNGFFDTGNAFFLEGRTGFCKDVARPVVFAALWRSCLWRWASTAWSSSIYTAGRFKVITPHICYFPFSFLFSSATYLVSAEVAVFLNPKGDFCNYVGFSPTEFAKLFPSKVLANAVPPFFLVSLVSLSPIQEPHADCTDGQPHRANTRGGWVSGWCRWSTKTAVICQNMQNMGPCVWCFCDFPPSHPPSSFMRSCCAHIFGL